MRYIISARGALVSEIQAFEQIACAEAMDAETRCWETVLCLAREAVCVGGGADGLLGGSRGDSGLPWLIELMGKFCFFL